MRDDAGLKSLFKQTTYAFFTAIPVVERKVIYPHCDKTVSEFRRHIAGRIWVDDEDLMIVKSKGKAVPETKDNKFPIVETWRENVDGKYWFPSFASADDQLVFDSGQVVRMRMRVKYADYKMGRTDVIVGDAEDVSEQPQPSPSPSPKKP